MDAFARVRKPRSSLNHIRRADPSSTTENEAKRHRGGTDERYCCGHPPTRNTSVQKQRRSDGSIPKPTFVYSEGQLLELAAHTRP